MNNQIQLPPHRIEYRIRNSDHYFMTGIDREGRQVLIGVLFGINSPDVVGVFFDKSGNCLESVANPVVRRSGEDDESAAVRGIAELQGALILTPATISIKKFWLNDRQVGIKDLPEHYQAFLDNPEDFDEPRRNELTADVRRWFSEGDFVLWWGEDYYLDKEGDVSSS